MYSHKDQNGREIGLIAGKVVCVGRNYADHIKELNNPMPERPILFIKPSTAICDLSQPITIPQHQGECHNELEIAVLIQSTLCKAHKSEVLAAVWGYGLGLDLTLRDVQSKLKQQGLPWERAKAFDGSCPLSQFIEREQVDNEQLIDFSLSINGDSRQVGNTKMMLTSIVELLVDISQCFTLTPGDVVMTGTPKGVGPLSSKDILEMTMKNHLSVRTHVQ